MKTQKNLFQQMVVVFVLFITYGVVDLCNMGTIGVLVHALLLVLILLFLTVNFHGTRPNRNRALTVLILFALRAIGYEVVGSFLGTLFGGGVFSAIFLDALLIFCWVLLYQLLGGNWKRMRGDQKAFRDVVTTFVVVFAIGVVVDIVSILLFSPDSLVSMSAIGVLDYVQSLQMLYNVLAIKSAVFEAVIVSELLRINAKITTVENDTTQMD